MATPRAADQAPSQPRMSQAMATRMGPTTTARRTVLLARSSSTGRCWATKSSASLRSNIVVLGGVDPHPVEAIDGPGDDAEHDEPRVGIEPAIEQPSEQPSGQNGAEEAAAFDPPIADSAGDDPVGGFPIRH